VKAILDSLNLIPETSNLDGVLMSTVSTRQKKRVENPKENKHIQVKLFDPEPGSSNKVVSLPRLCKLRVVRSSRDLSLPRGYGLVSAGRYGEIWCKGDGCVAIVRRKNSQVKFFDSDALNHISSYMREVAQRGLSMVQATDIVCNELCQ
jgi:hypothetical protein